jgi:parvulin-like peptidyl-prolyl isomerase
LAKKKNVEKAPREMTRRQLSHHKRQERRQRIIFISGIAIIAAIVLIIVAGWFMSEFYPLHRTVIKVNDTKINMAQFVDMLAIAGQNQQAGQIQAMASSVANEIIQDQLIKEGASKFNINVSDQDVKAAMKNAALPVNDASMSLIRTQILQSRLKSEYFGPLMPESDNQVYMMAMLVESDSLALDIRDRLVNGDNFTALAGEYAQNYTSKQNKGDYGWHPASILLSQTGSSIPLDFAFGAEAGALSPPLSDNVSSKQLGYWLLKVNARIPEEESANVSALLASSEAQAKDIKARLESGEELGPIADEFSQYSPSQEGHGELGVIDISENISNAFNGYVTNPATELGKWSAPIREDQYWTKGGAWLVKVVDKENNRKLSTEDRDTIITNAYNDWVSQLWGAASANIMSNMSAEQQQWAVDRVIKRLKITTG